MPGVTPADQLARTASALAESGRLVLRQWHNVRRVLADHDTCDRCALFAYCGEQRQGVAKGVSACDQVVHTASAQPPLDEEALGEIVGALREQQRRLAKARKTVRRAWPEGRRGRPVQALSLAMGDLRSLAEAVPNLNLAPAWRNRWREYLINVGNRILAASRAVDAEAQWNRIHG